MYHYLLILCGFLTYVNSARILCMFQMPSVSHQVVFQPIWKELALRGHDVTVVTPLPLKDPSIKNLKEIDVSNILPIALTFNFIETVSVDAWPHIKTKTMYEANYAFAEAIFNNEEFKKIYTNPNEKFDLIIIQSYISPIWHSLGGRFKAPVIGVNSMNGYIGSHIAIGNPHHPALYTDMYTPYQAELTFLERWYNTFFYIWANLFVYFEGMPKSDRIARKYLGDDLPYLADLEKNISAMMLTTNPIVISPRPAVPTLVEIGRLHIQPVKPLPKDLKNLLDNAKEGVLYFSLGSNVLSKGTSDKFKQMLLETFAELPYTVLWKYEDASLKNIPKNVHTGKWLPQQDILAHPNVKGFLMQCGLQSLEEAFHHGVPVACIPFISDQALNLNRLIKYDIAIGFDRHTVTKEQLKAGIMEIINNDKYRKRIKWVNDLLNDEPMKPLEKVMWWVEYVIRHKGTSHLRSPTADISWFNFLLLDVIGATLLVTLIPLYIIYKILSILISLVKPTKKPIKKKKN